MYIYIYPCCVCACVVDIIVIDICIQIGRAVSIFNVDEIIVFDETEPCAKYVMCNTRNV